MNAVAEIFTGFEFAAVVKLFQTLRQRIARLDAVKRRNADHADDDGGKRAGEEKNRKFFAEKPFEKIAQTCIKRADFITQK